MRRTAVFLCAWASVAPHAALAAGDQFRVTDKEKAACTEDAVRLCMNAYPDELKLLSCMKANRASLSPTCLAAFDAGVKRRHL